MTRPPWVALQAWLGFIELDKAVVLGQRLIEFCQENALVIANTLFQQHEKTLTHGHLQMVNTEIKLIIFFGAKDGEALYSQQKQDQELTVAQIMNSLLPNAD